MNKTNGSSVAILFPDEWIAFSPTIVRLAKHLSKNAEVQVYAFHTGRVSENSQLSSHIFRLCAIAPGLARQLRKFYLLPIAKVLTMTVAAWRAPKHSQIVAVDFFGAISARLARRQFHFLSLELTTAPWFGHWLIRNARSLIFPNEARLEIQLGGAKARQPILFLPNSPETNTHTPEKRERRPPAIGMTRLVHLGHAIPAHGLGAMLELLHRHEDVSLTLKGLIPASDKEEIQNKHSQLLASQRLILDEGYLTESEIPTFLRHFDAGLCFYDLEIVGRKNVNYLTSPSGKMFEYFRAGIPCLGSNLPGLRPIADHQAGALCDSLNAADIDHALDKVRSNHSSFSEGAIKAAKHYDFGAAALLVESMLRADRTP